MDFSGLIAKYPANRPLTEQERAHRLRQKQRLDLEPHYQLSVIQMNSTYLETVDKWFGWKGALSAVMFVIIGIFVGGCLGLVHTALTRAPGSRSPDDDFFILVAVGLMVLPLLALATWLLCKESFAYTHYPIRFNRKTRIVHVFRPDGSVLSVPWDEVFFTLGHLAQWNEWEIRGHVLKPDKATVEESFALSYVGSLCAADVDPKCTQFSANDFVRAHWEFIRRFMEEGPQAVSTQVQFCMPIDGRRERARVSIERVFANIAGAPFLLYCLLFPVCAVVSFFRLIAMTTSKIPRWPKDIAATCVIAADDPYAMEGTVNGDRVAVFPEAARAAGVNFAAPARSSRGRPL
jgi:hypothetical protein